MPELADDPDDQAAMARARASVKALKRRGLVETMRMVDPDRLVDTASTGVELGAGWSRHYVAEPNTREWYGIWVRLSTTEPTRPLPRPPEL